MLLNEKIKAAEVRLTGLQGEDLGELPREEALALARRLKADLVCVSLMSSPPPCKLVARGTAMQLQQQEKRGAEAGAKPAKVKEIRLTAQIEDHDYDTKRRQAEKLLLGGDDVQLVVKLQGKEGAAAKALLERMAAELAEAGAKQSGIQLSGKQAAVRLQSKSRP